MLCIYISLQALGSRLDQIERTIGQPKRPKSNRKVTLMARAWCIVYIYVYTCWFMCTSIKFTQWFTSYTAELLKNICGFVHRSLFRRSRNMVDVLNFGSGSGDINVMSSLKLWDPKSGKTATSVSKTYVGEFSQSNSPYVPWIRRMVENATGQS